MDTMMKAAVVRAFGQPLVIEDRPRPKPGRGQVLVKIAACGVCHTDLHAAQGDWPLKPALPFTPGHEGIGIVVALGAGVSAQPGAVREGDRVGVPWLYSACGHCEFCLAAQEPVCAEAQFGGYTKNGGFAEYIVADPNYVAHIPAGLAARDAAPLICAGITSYKGLKETQARPGQWVVISGIGGLGHLGVQYAKAMGLLVCAVDIDDGKLAHATQLGADATLNYSTQDVRETLKALTGGKGPDVVYDPVGGDLAEPVFRSIAWRGRYLVVGFAGGGIPSLPLNLSLLKGAAIVGVFWGDFVRREPAASAAGRARFHRPNALRNRRRSPWWSHTPETRVQSAAPAPAPRAWPRLPVDHRR